MASKGWPRPQHKARDRLHRTRKNPRLGDYLKGVTDMSYVKNVNGVFEGADGPPEPVGPEPEVETPRVVLKDDK